MRIYFGFTVAGDRSSRDDARRMVELLEGMGHAVLTRHLVEENAWEADRRITAQQVYERDMAWLAAADIIIAEVSGSSFGLGFEAGYALAGGGKDVLLFFRTDARDRISRMITGNTHPRCTLVPYSSAEEMEARLRALVAASDNAAAGRV